MNFSKSGIGYSIGVRGTRIGKDAKGCKYSQVSIPHTGIYRRDYYDSKTRQLQPLRSCMFRLGYRKGRCSQVYNDAPFCAPHGYCTAGAACCCMH